MRKRHKIEVGLLLCLLRFIATKFSDYFFVGTFELPFTI